jgi:uncharacterized protein YqeY
MNKYEIIKNDMKESLRTGNKSRRTVLADMVAAIEKAAVAGRKRVEITDQLVDDVLLKYKKTTQEMIDTCPDTEQYATRKAEYNYYMEVVNEYAPSVITDKLAIINLINQVLYDNNIAVAAQNKGVIMKTVMPFLKNHNCDMRVAQEALKTFFN